MKIGKGKGLTEKQATAIDNFNDRSNSKEKIDYKSIIEEKRKLLRSGKLGNFKH